MEELPTDAHCLGNVSPIKTTDAKGMGFNGGDLGLCKFNFNFDTLYILISIFTVIVLAGHNTLHCLFSMYSGSD